jgi:hypothetical protein
MAQLAISISSSQAAERNADYIRRRALERLYERRAAVDELIVLLERYQDTQQRNLAPCVPINALRKCS